MRPWTIGRSEQAVPHRIYDLSIADMRERQLKSKPFNSGVEMAQFLGMPANKVSYWRGKRYFSDKHNKEFAIRLDKNK